MLDRDGFRPNVGIILLNARNQVFWGKRLRTHSWQFPQGGIKYGESPEQAMFRELHEEVGLRPEHVRILARTRDWLRYEVPDHFIRKDARGHYRGQKQIWFLLRLTGRDSDLDLRASDHPEFDAWRWNDYWVPLEWVIEFKRGVYQMALTELARFLPRAAPHNRYLRGGMRGRGHDDAEHGPGPGLTHPLADLHDHDHPDHPGHPDRSGPLDDLHDPGPDSHLALDTDLGELPSRALGDRGLTGREDRPLDASAAAERSTPLGKLPLG